MARCKYQKSAQRCAAIRSFIQEYVKEKGYPPTVREICAHVGLKSPSTVHTYLKMMEKDGSIKRTSDYPRAIKLTKNAPWNNTVLVPLIGTVTAGVPITAEENYEEVFELPNNLLGTKAETFMLRVKGDSMIKIGILDGDLIIIKKQNYANDGDVVVALVNKESATVKRFFKDKKRGCIRLQPENDNMEPFYETDVTILGLVIGVYRSM